MLAPRGSGSPSLFIISLVVALADAARWLPTWRVSCKWETVREAGRLASFGQRTARRKSTPSALGIMDSSVVLRFGRLINLTGRSTAPYLFYLTQ